MRHLINFREVAVGNYSDGAGQNVPYQGTLEDGMAKLRLSIGHNVVTAETFGQMSFLGDLCGAPEPHVCLHVGSAMAFTCNPSIRSTNTECN